MSSSRLVHREMGRSIAKLKWKIDLTSLGLRVLDRVASDRIGSSRNDDVLRRFISLNSLITYIHVYAINYLLGWLIAKNPALFSRRPDLTKHQNVYSRCTTPAINKFSKIQIPFKPSVPLDINHQSSLLSVYLVSCFLQPFT